MCKYSGNQCRLSINPKNAPATAPSTPPTNKIHPKSNSTSTNPAAPCCDEMMKLKTSTAKRAPSGCMTMPSQRSTLATFLLSFNMRNMGTITVGPVTTTSEPNNNDNSQGKSSNQCVAKAMVIHVTAIPTVTMRLTTDSRPLISLKFKVNAPSNKITDTARETTGNNKSPNIRSGSIIPVTGLPRTIPNSSNNKIEGSFNHQANH